MKKSFLSAIAVSVSIFALSLLAPSGACAAVAKNPVAETYMVVKITDPNKTDNKVEYKVVATSQYKDEEKRVKDDNDKKVEEWQDMLKNDPKTPHPGKIVIVKLKTGYKIQKIAQDYVDKLKADDAAKVAPKTTPKQGG